MSSRRFTFKRILLALLVLIVLGFVAYIPYVKGDYYATLDRYSGDISRGDVTAAKEDLQNLKYFYALHEKLVSFHLGWIAGDLFNDAKSYQAALSYISRGYGQVIEELETEEGFWAYYIRANARFRQAQEMTANALNLQDPVKKKEQLQKADEMAKTTKDDYLAAIKSDPNGINEPKWNYDIVTDDEARMRALMPKPGQIKVKLGVPGGGSGRGPEGKDDDGEKSDKPKDLDKKGGEQPGGEGGKPRRAG